MIRNLFALTLFALCSANVSAQSVIMFDEQFTATALDMNRWSVYPADVWSLTTQDSIRSTRDEKQDHAHLTLSDRYQIQELSIRLRAIHSDKPSNQIKLVLYPENSKGVIVSIESHGIKVIQNVADGKPNSVWFNHQSDSQTWIDLRMIVGAEQTKFLLKNKQIAQIATGDLSRPTLIRVQTYACDVELDRVTVKGIRDRKPKVRIGKPIDQVNYSDPTRQRHYPHGVVTVDKPGEDVDLSRAVGLSAVERWQIGEPDYRHDEFTDQTKFAGQSAFHYQVGKHTDTDVPTRLREFARKKTPEEGFIYFNLANGGDYTLKVYLSGAKNLGNQLSVFVDGQLVYRDLMRGSNPKAIHSWFREHIPLRLSAGPHVVQFRADYVNARFLSYMMSLYLDSIALEPGVSPLVFQVDAKQERPLGERTATVSGSRTLARDFHYHITNLPAGKLELELLFYEAVTDHEGFRRFNVAGNGKKLLKDYDIVADVGPGKIASKRFEVQADDDGLLDLHFAATVGRAQINTIRIRQRDKKVVTINCGASPDRSYGFMAASDLHAREKDTVWDNAAFDSPVNVVANPGFESDTNEKHWRPIADAMPPYTRSDLSGSGQMYVDDTVAYRGKKSLRLGSTKGSWGVRANSFMLDWSRPVRFTAWGKAQNATGKTSLALQWLIPDGISEGHYDARGSGIARGGLKLGPVVMSEPLAGTFDWKPIQLDAQPPRGAAGAIIMIRSDDNAGHVWFDDMRLDGYGHLPIQIIATVGGYQLGGHNSAVVLSIAPIENGRYELKQRDQTVTTGELTSLGWCDWLERHAYLADLSGHKSSGTFTLHVTASDSRNATSESFTVKPQAYLDLARHAAFYFYAMRCGQETLGYHMACHLDDALVQSPYYDRASRVEPGRNFVGGWHDAGDYGKFHQRTWGPLYSLAALATQIGPQWQQYGKNVPDIVSEVMWGADYTCKIHEGNGLFVGKINGGFQGGHPAFPPSLETDGDPNTVDGFGRTAAWLTMATPEPAFAMAASARAVRPYDAQRADRYLHVAETCYVQTTSFWNENRGDHAADWRDLFFESKALMAAIELHRATGHQRYLDDAKHYLNRVLPLVDDLQFAKAPYCWSVRWQKGSLNNFQYDFLIGPLLLLRDHPKLAEANEIRRVVRKSVEQVILPSLSPERTPFGQITNLVEDDLWYYRTNYMTELYPQTAYVLALAANVLNEPAWLPHAERNLQWMTGRNVRNMSYVSGLTDRQSAPWTGLIHVPGLQHGTIPGAIAKGMNFGYGKVDWTGRSYRTVGYGMPAGFFWAYLDTGDGNQPHFPAMEIWEWFNHPVIMAAIELHQAYAPGHSGKNLPLMPLGTANLIDNAGFERIVNDNWAAEHRPKWAIAGNGRPDNWDLNGDQFGTLEVIDDPKQARFGERCLKVVKPDDYRSAMLINRRPFFEIKPGQVYWVGIWLRGKGRVKLWSHECEGPTAAKYRYSRQLAEVDLQETWDRIDVPYVVTGKDPRGRLVTHTRFSFALAPGTEAYVDQFEVRRMAQPRVPRPRRLQSDQ